MAKPKQAPPKPLKRPAQRTAFDRLWPWLFGGVVVVGIAVVAYAIRSRPNYPRAGAHWHAAYTVEVCGTVLAPFPPSPGNVHTHGDGVIHVHPATDEEGKQATIRTFLESVGARVADGAVTLPNGRTFRSGARCPDGRPGTWAVYVNGKRVNDLFGYHPQDRDRIRIVFGPAP